MTNYTMQRYGPTEPSGIPSGGLLSGPQVLLQPTQRAEQTPLQPSVSPPATFSRLSVWRVRSVSRLRESFRIFGFLFSVFISLIFVLS